MTLRTLTFCRGKMDLQAFSMSVLKVSGSLRSVDKGQAKEQ